MDLFRCEKSTTRNRYLVLAISEH